VGGVHGNGSVEIAFDTAVVGPEASYDRATGRCSVSCHHLGGARDQPAWGESEKMTCGSCHASPPPGHFPGACTTCHAEANADGTALVPGPLHMNGRVDLGSGSGTCGACHGKGDDPWPGSAAHASHRDPTLAAPTACTTCHAVPAAVISPGHLNGTVEITLSGPALARGSGAAWNGTTCTSVACHGSALVDPPRVVPAWTDASGAARQCGACHGVPPTQHTASTSCDRSTCHGDEVDRSIGVLAISPAGKALHVNGVIDAQ
jgi:predicted CxxxxCH...CXXCH cytochrome family protein